MFKKYKIITTILFLILTVAAQAAENELTFWNFWDPKLILPVIEAFEKENPGVKIHNEQLTWNNGLDKIVVAMANNRAPDICEMGSTWMGKFMAEGALLDVTEEFSPLKDKYIMWEPAQMNGRIYGMPWLAGTRVMFYNKDLFIKAGLDPDKPPVTWDEFLEDCKKIHNPQNGIFGFGMNAGEGHILYKKFLPFGWGNGARVLDEKGNFAFDSKEMKEALEFYLKLKEYSYCEKQDLLNDAFKRGKLGFEISGSWIFARLPIEAPNLNFGTCLIPKPSYEKGFSTSFMGGEILVLFKSCKNKELATKFIKYLTRSENALLITKEAWTSFPANVGAFSDPAFSEPRTQVFFEQMKTGIHPPVHRLWIELETIVNTTVEKAMYGEPIDKVMKEAREEYERIIKSKSKNETLNKTEENKVKETSNIANTPQTSQTNQTNWLMVLVSFIAVGTLINAVLMAFILYELKKKRLIFKFFNTQSPAEKGHKRLLFLMPWLLTLVVFWLYPLLFSLILSFSDYDVFHPELFSFVGFENYARLIKDAGFRQALYNTFFFVVGTTPVTTVLALVLALMINSVRRGNQVFRSVFFLPSIVSIVVTASIFKSIYSPVGMLNRIVEFFGFTGHGWLVEKSFAMPAIMMMNIWAYTGYYMVLYLAALTAVPKQLYEAAEVDGADEWQQFWYITLPQIRYMTIFVIVINTIRSWQVFPEVFTLTHGGPVGTTNTLVHHLYDTAFRFHDMGYASAISFVLLGIIMIFAFAQMRILQGRKESKK